MYKAARVLLPVLFLPLFFSAVNADELLDVQKKIDQKKKEYSETQANLAQIKSDIASLSTNVGSTQGEADAANAKVTDIRKDLEKVEEDLDEKKAELNLVLGFRDQQVQFLYKHPGSSPLELFITSNGFSQFSQMIGIQGRLVGTSKEVIESINAELAIIKENRTQIAAAKDELEKISAEINSRLASLQGQLSFQSNQQDFLSSQIVQIQSSLSQLTEKQKQLIAQKLAASSQRQTIGDQVPPSTSLPNAGFSPAFSLATYGYPHRVGMNQYGAYGRALAGQSYQTILKAYYTGVAIGPYPTPSTIKVNGCNEYGQCFNNQVYGFEDYLKRLYEMPASWPTHALRAQAVAARTYVLNWIQTHPGQAICPNQGCQVIKKELNATSWQQAVNATKGIVITYAGSPITAWYASTAGGYTLSSQEVWGGFRPYAIGKKDFAGSWPSGAYDKSSPWFHKPWGGKCGNSGFPWLTKAETTDIFDALILSKSSSSYNQYLSPTDGCLGSKGWSHSKVMSELNKKGIKPIGNLQNVFVGYDGGGRTSSVTVVSSNYPAKTFNANDFRSIYHLRSPGTRVILTNLFDVITQ